MLERSPLPDCKPYRTARRIVNFIAQNGRTKKNAVFVEQCAHRFRIKTSAKNSPGKRAKNG